ncbi:peptidase domain-containing ABC transporter [Bacillus sp. SJS]|uniref:peptidase domain-containing ABC transporter n=1 Tax=Bacillus sp. SJS TaxID=1423321 RepID=UPI00068C2512|nr:peptidase domain-containing ABC transporter [Bacillus sp. SJS]KZZ84918.1 hypothetical protein AS29_007640 [Bacillus sp. SJS]
MGIHHRKRKIPYIPQMQQTECGLCCAAMITRYYKSQSSLSELRDFIEAGRDGLTLYQLNSLLLSLKFETHVYKTEFEGLWQLELPAILYWNDNHYVILEEIGPSKAVIVDPAFGRKKLTREELHQSFSNYAVTVKPSDEFVPVRKKENIWYSFFSDVFHHKYLFLKIVLLSFITYLFTLSIPIAVQYLIDEVVMKNKFSQLNSLIGTAAGLIAFFGLLIYIRGKNLISFQMVLEKSLMGKTFMHLLRVPYKFFEVRSFGDILFRMNSLHIIRDLLSEQLIKGLIDFGSIFFILMYMLYSSPVLAGAALILFFINGALTMYTRPHILEANQHEIAENSKLQTIQVEALYSILGVKTTGLEDTVYKNWNHQFNRALQKFKKRSEIQNSYTSVQTTIQTLSPLLILLIGIYLFAQKSISLGEMIAFHTLSITFFAVGVSIFQTYNNFLLANAYLERVRDITDSETEENPEKPAGAQITGDIKLSDVSFSYTKHSEKVVKKISMHIKRGEKVAIVGPSGSGKSTLSKILLGLYMPTEGEIYYDDIELGRYNKQELRQQMGIVPQDINLFNNSIMENIKMNKEDVTMEDIQKAASVAQIAEEIESMPMGYHTLVSEMGMNLSGGQRQRIALARALISQPKVIILDEATSSLDSINEALVGDYLKEMGCTRIVIAHRLSTIYDSDRIFVMENGSIIDEGTHAELIGNKGLYFELYKTQLDSKEELAI